jgi:nucleotide-binding universal stress UspA family protein
MKKLLIPTDFSASAKNAIDFAIQSAMLFPIEITIMHAFEMHGNMYTDSMGVIKEFNQSQLDEAQHKLTELKKQIESKEGITVKTIMAELNLKDAIKKAIEEFNFDIVVMGTLGASGIKEKLWGTNTASVVGEIDIPVLAIPHDYKWKKPEKFLIATNNFEVDHALLDHVFDLAGAYQAHVQAAVFTDEDDDKPATFIQHSHQKSEYEKTLKEKYHDDKVTVTQLFGTEFEDSLQDYITESEIDVLIMITYQRGFFSRIFHPSKTKKLVYHTHIPLLAIPAK